MKSKQVFLLMGLIFVAFTGSIGLAQDKVVGGTESSSKITLSGGVDHAKQLKPIVPSLRAGAKFNPSLMKRLAPQDYWYRIPNWLGGIWQRNQQNLLKQKNLTLKAKLTSTLLAPPRLGLFKSQVRYRWGYQYDRMGNIWNYVRFPYIARVHGANTYTVQVVRKAVPVRISDKIVVLKFLSSNHRIDLRSNIIVSSEQSEALSMYALFKPNVLYARYSTKKFDSDGKPVSIQESESYIPQIEKFYPENFKDGKDLRLSLRNYLLANQPNLVPQAAIRNQMPPHKGIYPVIPKVRPDLAPYGHVPMTVPRSNQYLIPKNYPHPNTKTIYPYKDPRYR